MTDSPETSRSIEDNVPEEGGGVSSAEADVRAAFDDDDAAVDQSGTDAPAVTTGLDDEAQNESIAADVDAAYDDDSSDTP